MELINKLNNLSPTKLDENITAGGAVGGGDISTASLPLFASLVKRPALIPQHPRIIKFANNQSNPKKKRNKKLGISEAFRVLEDLSPDRVDKNFDTSEVIAKLKSLENKESVNFDDGVTFGLVDTNGGIVKVTIPRDQSAGFEQDIQHLMGEYDESESAPEIAEILYKLKNNYTIVDVEWPEVEEDQEESASQLDPGEEGVPGEEGMPGEEAGADMMGGEQPGTESITSLLQQVIDMMKTDADARKAEAQAREAEFKTRQAVAARGQAMARVKQEEQFLDMEEYNKNKKERERESKRLAQLAKWKHDVANNDQERPAQEPLYDFLPGEENEEYASLGGHSYAEEEERVYRTPTNTKAQPSTKQVRGKISPSDVAKFIMSRVK